MKYSIPRRNDDEEVKVGLCPNTTFTFSAEDAFKYKVEIRKQIESFGMDIDIVDLEGLNEEGLLYDDHINADLIAKRFKEEEVDAVFFRIVTSAPKTP